MVNGHGPTWDSNNEYHGATYATKSPNGFCYFDIMPEIFALDHKTTSRDQKNYVVADDGFGYSVDRKTILTYGGPGSAITSLTISGGTKLGEAVFNDCEKLRSVVFASGTTSIHHDTFNNCWSIAAVEIPATLTTITERAFVNCRALKNVYFGSSESQWVAISVGQRNDALTKATIRFGRHRGPQPGAAPGI